MCVVGGEGVFNHYTHSFVGLYFKAEDICFILSEALGGSEVGDAIKRPSSQ